LILSRHGKILVVDDSRSMQYRIEKLLNELGYINIIKENNGIKAIERMKTTCFDLILCDWMMPELNGLEFLKWIRSKDEYKHIPFIMITTNGNIDVKGRTRGFGKNGFLLKTFTADQLRDAINLIFNVFDQISELVSILDNISDIEIHNILLSIPDRKIALCLLYMNDEKRNIILSKLIASKSKRISEELLFLERIYIKYEDINSSFRDIGSSLKNGKNTIVDKSYIRPLL
jgi:two-component system, chemotaxis family, chemotaxis protein CheY